MIASAGELIALASLRRGTVSVRGSVIHVRELTVADRAEFARLGREEPARAPVFLVARCTTTPDGAPLFASDAEAEGIAAGSPEVVDAIAGEVLRLSNLGGESRKGGGAKKP